MSTVCYQFHRWTGSNLELLHETQLYRQHWNGSHLVSHTANHADVCSQQGTCAHFFQLRLQPPTHQIFRYKHAHISSGKCQSVHHLSSCVFLNTMASGFSHTAITLHSRRKRNESNTAVITRLLQRWIITSQWLPCLLKTYLSSNPFSWVLILHTKIRFFCFFPNTQTGVYSYSQSSNSHPNFVFMSMFVYTFIAQYFQLCQLSYDLSFWQTFDKKNHDSGTKKKKRKVIKTLTFQSDAIAWVSGDSCQNRNITKRAPNTKKYIQNMIHISFWH